MATRTRSAASAPGAGATVTDAAYERLALADPDRGWELHQGRLREKPGMSVVYNRTAIRLGGQLLRQPGEWEVEVRVEAGRVRHGQETYYIPDLFVVPTSLAEAILDVPTALEVYDAPLPLVAEAWSPSTGQDDVDEKIPAYQRRGDQEIWRIDPSEQTLTAWRREGDGGYRMEVVRGGTVVLVGLPGVEIDLDALFRRVSPAADGEAGARP